MKFRKKILALFLAAATVVSSVSVVSVSAESEGGGTVVIGAQTDVVTLDPGRCYEPYANLILRACYDCLYEFQDGVDGAQPSLATGIEYSEDGLTATVTIREDVVFASGNPLTAKDV